MASTPSGWPGFGSGRRPRQRRGAGRSPGAWRRPATSWVVPRSKRPPAGFESAGLAGRFLLFKALFVHRDEPADERIHTDAVLATCLRHWSALAPLHRWLTDNTQTPEHPAAPGCAR